MTFYDNYAERLRVTVEIPTTQLDNIKTDIINDFETASTKEIAVIEPDGTHTNKIIQTTQDKEKEKILVHPNYTILSGTLIELLKGYTWLVTEVEKTGDIFYTCTLKRMNRLLKWMVDSTITEGYALVSPLSLSSIGIKENEFITMSTRVIQILFQNNISTRVLTRDKRIMVDDVPYKITKVETTIYDDCLLLTCMEDELKLTDTNDVCDYVAPVTIPDIAISGPSTINRGFKKEYVLLDGETILTATWAIKDAVSYASLIVSTNGVYVQVSNLSADIGKTITLEATYSTIKYSKNIVIVSLI